MSRGGWILFVGVVLIAAGVGWWGDIEVATGESEFPASGLLVIAGIAAALWGAVRLHDEGYEAGFREGREAGYQAAQREAEEEAEGRAWLEAEEARGWSDEDDDDED